MKQKLIVTALAAALVSGSALAAGSYKIPTIVKIAGSQWFVRMESGVKEFAAATGNNAYELGPTKADAQLQAQIVEDAIAQKVDAMAVVPFSPEALEPVLKKARDAGIKVVTHEAAGIQNADFDVEAFRNKDYGEHFMKALAKCMGEEGEYAVFVASLTSKTHNEWVDASVAYQKAHYPKMTLVGDKNESNESAQEAYAKTQELLRAHPKIKGFQGSASIDVAGIGLAIDERGLADQTCVIGTSLPSVANEYLESGAVDVISFWDPARAGEAMNRIAVKLLDGQTVKAGDDLGVSGYNAVELDGNVIYGQAWVDVTKDNAKDYPF